MSRLVKRKTVAIEEAKEKKVQTEKVCVAEGEQ